MSSVILPLRQGGLEQLHHHRRLRGALRLRRGGGDPLHVQALLLEGHLRVELPLLLLEFLALELVFLVRAVRRLRLARLGLLVFLALEFMRGLVLRRRRVDRSLLPLEDLVAHFRKLVRLPAGLPCRSPALLVVLPVIVERLSRRLAPFPARIALLARLPPSARPARPLVHRPGVPLAGDQPRGLAERLAGVERVRGLLIGFVLRQCLEVRLHVPSLRARDGGYCGHTFLEVIPVPRLKGWGG